MAFLEGQTIEHGVANVRRRLRRQVEAALDFTTGGRTQLLHTRAKVVDMVFLIEGGYGAPAIEA